MKLRDLLRGNVLWLSLISLLNDTASEMIYPLLPLFLVVTLGAGPAFLGLVEGVAETTASLVKLGGGWLSDRLGRRKALVGWGYALAAAARPVVAVAAAPWHVLVVRFSDRVGKGIRTAPRDALLAESVDAARRGTAFGVHRAADHAGAVLGPLLAAGLLLLAPGQLRLVFALAAIPGIVAVFMLWPVREQPVAGPTRAPQPEAMAASAGGRSPPAPVLAPDGKPAGVPTALSAVAAPKSDAPSPAQEAAPRRGVRQELGHLGPAFPRYLLVLLIFTLGNASDAFLLLRAQDLGIALAAIPLLWGAHHVSKMLWSVPGGMLADRFGPRRAIIAGWLVYAAVYAGFAAAGQVWQVWALFLVYGLFYGLTEAPEKALVAALAPTGTRGLAFGAYHFAIGLAALPASLIFGLLWQAYGAAAAFLLGAALALLAALLLPLALPAQRPGSS